MYSHIKTLTKPFAQIGLLTPVRIFVLSTMIVNGGNYLYNLVIGRMLEPAAFAEAGLLITLLLVFSFLAMTFQIVTTKFSIEFEGEQLQAFSGWIKKTGAVIGLILMIVFLLFNIQITDFFQISSHWSVIVFALALPFYFLMSVDRGFAQGKEDYHNLSRSYQLEMWVRFFTTICFILFMQAAIGTSISLSILLSILAGFVVVRTEGNPITTKVKFEETKKVWRFFLLTVGYECAQILINYSDILLVKHYFDGHEAGLYTSMALIGRMIYFVTWMVVMILIPKVVKLRKQGQAFTKPLLQYLLIIALVSAAIISVAYWRPELVVTTLFGKAYLPVAHLLWQYGLATALFALANVFVYFFLSLDQYVPVYLAIGMGVLQLLILNLNHETLDEIILVQIINMSILLIVQILFFVNKR